MPITFILYFPNLSLNNGTTPRNHSNIIIFLGVTCIKDTPTDMVRKTSFELRWAFNLSCLHAGNRLLKKPSRVSDLKTTITKVNFNVRYFYHLPSFDFFLVSFFYPLPPKSRIPLVVYPLNTPTRDTYGNRKSRSFMNLH